MIILLSPAKTIGFSSDAMVESASQPEFIDDAAFLVGKLKKLSSKQLGKLMSVNDELAQLNAERFANWELPFHPGNAQPALSCFQGAVYRGLDAASLSAIDLEYAQQHLRIISGLYGVLRPLDLMQPYRLEMGLKWEVTAEHKNLYAYWENRLIDYVASESKGCVINLASKEYSKAALANQNAIRIVTPHFKDLVNGEYKSIMTYAKEARGNMARFAIHHKIQTPEALHSFNGMGYCFDPHLSSDQDWVFTRNQKSSS
ncbi:MAG: peroxide stress protein YaaA [Flavobacteriales bacterium]|jgi:cytoplasmic iron level regulating protein YaaA (DUF328/UPF0246 family)